MTDKQFFNNLSATYADVRKLDVKKINLKGKNILEYIKESVPTIKHSQDTRETVTENDLWGQYIETTADGTIIVHDDEVINPNAYASSNGAWNSSITKVEHNKAYTSSGFYANIQTEKIKDGYWMFNNCSNLESFTSDLSSLKNGKRMFADCFNLESFTSDLPSLTDGYSMFSYSKLSSFSSVLSSLTNCYEMFKCCAQLSSFSSDLPSLTDGSSMFYYCGNLKSFSSDLPSLTNGSHMFCNCYKLTTFSSDLSSLTDGYDMFNECTNLTSFDSDLSSLTHGSGMFSHCSQLSSFTSDLSSLMDGSSMFINCPLTTFTSDLPSLIDGEYMFYNCTNLNSFSSDLSSLTDGSRMFDGCKLDAESVMYIADTIKDIAAEKQLYTNGTIPYVSVDTTSYPYKYSAPKGFMGDGTYVYTYKNPKPITTGISASLVGNLTLGINVTNNSSTIKQQLEDFAKEVTFDTWSDLKTHFSNKGWKVTFQYGGTDTSITYDLRNGEQIIPCPIFAKLIQVEDKDSAEYCTEDASTFYNIEWGHDVTDTSAYTQFNSLEDAMTSWNVFPKENIISTDE